MRRKIADLKARMSPDARARAEARTKDMVAGMLLTEIRLMVGLAVRGIGFVRHRTFLLPN